MTKHSTDPDESTGFTRRRVNLPDNRELNKFLRDLKKSGGSILVTGNISEHVARQHMQLAFGDADRKRVLALADAPEHNPSACLPDGTTPADHGVRVVDRRDALRSAAAPNPAQTTDNTPDSQADDYLEVFFFRDQIQSAIDDLDDHHQLQPGDLRVVVNSLDGLLDSTDQTTVRGIVRGLAGFVRDRGGISYYHLRHPSDSDIARYLSEAVDAQLELRYGDHNTQTPLHRFHAPDRDLTTDWYRPHEP